MTLSRRRFLIGSATGAGRLRAQPPNAGPRAIDLHHHFVSPAYVKALAAKQGHHMAGYTTWFALDRLKTYTRRETSMIWIGTAWRLPCFPVHLRGSGLENRRKHADSRAK